MSMRLVSVNAPEFDVNERKPSRLERFARRLVLSRLEKLEEGQIVLSENGQHLTFGRLTEAYPLTAQIRIRNPKFYSEVAFGGAKGSRKNISAHYDLGNDFYQLWLDKTMMYSCAYFESPETSLRDASIEKLDRICRKLNLSAEDSVIEIGTGWGGFAIHAARHFGCHVTTTTISQQQHDYAAQAIRDAGLEDRITLLFDDYRDLEGQYDKLVSIEMIEAVGHEFHETYFKKCCELLKPDGQMLLQAITIADQRYDAYKTSVDFIKRYIFPGGCLASVTDMTKVMTGSTDMRVIHLEDIGPHYATTLREWHDRFFARIDEVRELGYSDAFIRMWQFYLAYCESAFLERVIGNVQMLMMRPDARPDSIRY